jgi:hypothetical protein
MAYADRRAGVLDRNFKTFAVDATVTRPAPDDTPIETLREDGGGLLWLTPTTEDAPESQVFARRERRRVAAFLKRDVPTCPIGTAIAAPDERGGDPGGWRVDGFVLDEAEHMRVSVVADETALSP